MENAYGSSLCYREAVIGTLETYIKKYVNGAIEKHGPVMGPLSISPSVVLLAYQVERCRSALLSEALDYSQKALMDYRRKTRELFQKMEL